MTSCPILRRHAKHLSTERVPVQFDMIPHTGIEVYGVEYFFGGGVQARCLCF